MVMVAVDLPEGAGVLVELLLLVQPASTLTPSAATALMTNAFLENQGRTGLTPSSSFLLGQGSPGSNPPDTSASTGYTGRDRFMLAESSESYISIAAAL